jgi:hypothetical protein
MKVSRSQMPQIDEKDIGKLIVFATKAGFPVLTAGDADAWLFSRHQDVDWEKVEKMPGDLLDKPILVTRLNEVIDGNHRLAKHEQEETQVPFIRFDCSFSDMLNLLAVFPFAYELNAKTPERN